MALPHDPVPTTELVCNRCESMANLPHFNPNAHGTEPAHDRDELGYCDYHGYHDAFSWGVF